MVWRRYVFDRQLRLLTMDAIERVEIAIRAQIVNRHTLKYGAFGYRKKDTLPRLSDQEHQEFLQRLDEATERSRKSHEPFVSHFFEKYTQEQSLPLWIVSELMTFCCMLTLYRGLESSLQKEIAQHYGVADKILLSWLKALNQTRNICAHHARLWNREFGIKPLIPRKNKHPEWHTPVPIPNNRLFGMLTVLHFLLIQVAPKSRWKQRLKRLFQDYSDIPLSATGFPHNFESSPLWQNPQEHVDEPEWSI